MIVDHRLEGLPDGRGDEGLIEGALTHQADRHPRATRQGIHERDHGARGSTLPRMQAGNAMQDPDHPDPAHSVASWAKA